ncbi:hypothetical protein CYMTET_51841 [Cymbomonas tetramitiformis]|uniref:Uncharacterized protein n=1 Tax=Cymbomonas tetramitiformis TaxID=36881 RepID=A0AAE0BLE1_9CHLO|nr:hypothetical protein CYMTET_51841 [Cymbomonas tetramitiformis]
MPRANNLAPLRIVPAGDVPPLPSPLSKVIACGDALFTYYGSDGPDATLRGDASEKIKRTLKFSLRVLTVSKPYWRRVGEEFNDVLRDGWPRFHKSDATAVCHEAELFFFGKVEEGGVWKSQLYKFDLQVFEELSANGGPPVMDEVMAVVHMDVLYIYGRSGDRNPLDMLYRYQFQTHRWERVTGGIEPLPSLPAALFAVTLPNVRVTTPARSAAKGVTLAVVTAHRRSEDGRHSNNCRSTIYELYVLDLEQGKWRCESDVLRADEAIGMKASDATVQTKEVLKLRHRDRVDQPKQQSILSPSWLSGR